MAKFNSVTNVTDDPDDLISMEDISITVVNGTCACSSFAVKMGDVEMDGDIDVSDELAILRAVVNITSLNTMQQLAADVDENGEINVEDALAIGNYVVDNISSFWE